MTCRAAGLALAIAGGTFASSASPVSAQVIVAGTLGTPETDLTPEQEQRLLAEYWTVAKRYRTEPARAISEMGAWTRDRIGKAQSIQYQPETAARPVYLEGRAEWEPAVLRTAAMLHSDLGLAAFRERRIQDFEFHVGIADGWFALADNRQSAPGSLRSRWNVTVARLLLASGEIGMAERHLMRISERIAGDPAILLAYATVKETQALRIVAEVPGGRLEEPAAARKPRDAALAAAVTLFERVLGVAPAAGAANAEARLRLAHVHTMRGDDARAETMLTDLVATPLAAPLKYVASLVLGGIRERKQQWDVAARTYLEAVLAVPDGQSAYVALAQVMHRAGQVAEASTVLQRLFDRRVTNLGADPWWTYPLGLDLTMDGRFEDYRVEVRK